MASTYYVNVRIFTGTGRVGKAVSYIAHREERLPGGQTREIHGIGEHFRALGGDEAAIVRRLREDARGLKQPRYCRIKLTVDDRAAERLARLGAPWSELALRDAVDRTLRGAMRKAQGVFVLHQNEQGARPFGNPHVHVLLGPRLSDGRTFYISKRRLQELKTRWTEEVGRTLDRNERRLGISPRVPARSEPTLGLGRRLAQERRHLSGPGVALRPGLLVAARETAEGRTLEAAAAAARVLPGAPGALARAQREIEQGLEAPDRLATRHALRLATRFMPEPIRRVVKLTRTAGLFLPRN